MRLYVMSTIHILQDARSEAEEQIYKQINDKIDDFLELGLCDYYCIWLTFLNYAACYILVHFYHIFTC